MENPYGPIYYVSKDTIDQLYRQRFGPPKDVTVSQSKGIWTWIKARVGLNKLFSIVMDVSGEGAVKASREKTIVEEMARADVDHILSMIEELFNSDSVTKLDYPDITNLEEDFYSFSHSLKFEIEGGDDSVYKTLLHEESRDGIKIRVTCETSGFIITGVTSAENWTTSSMLLNFLENIREDDVEKTEVAGVLHPVNVDTKDGKPRITAQYLFLCSTSLLPNSEHS